jgi:hypothetical protein
VKTVFQKSDDELQIVWGVIYTPDVPDSQNDFMRREALMKAAYSWMAKGKPHCIDVEHDKSTVNAFVVESFIARKNDPDFDEGAWVVGVHIPDESLWQSVKKGEFNGFSMMGVAHRQPAVDMEVPGEVTGLTKSEQDHRHEFSVAYAPNGEFIGGVTDTVDGHYHVIRRGTVTEESAGHSHTFDFVRGFRDAEGDDQSV